MAAERNPRWDNTLESRGPEAVRGLLQRSPGTGKGAVVQGLGDQIDAMPDRGYAEQWLTRKDTERQVQLDRQNAKRDWWARGIAIAAMIVTVLAWWFPHK